MSPHARFNDSAQRRVYTPVEILPVNSHLSNEQTVAGEHRKQSVLHLLRS